MPPLGGSLATDAPLPLAISADGSTVAFIAHVANGPDRVWVRSLAAGEARELPGTEDASFPFFSPDGGSIAFFSGTELRRVPAAGGPVTKITDCADPRGGAWGARNQILFAPRGYGGLAVVDADGGTPRYVTSLDSTLGEVTHRYPYFLPDGEHYLFLARRGGAGRGEKPAVYVAKLGQPGRKRVLEVASNVVYASEHLLYVEQGTLVAQAFDPGRRVVRGAARPISDQVAMDERFSRAPFAASRNGVLVFMTGRARQMSQLQWHDRGGRLLGLVGEPGWYAFGGQPRLDATGRRAAIAMLNPERGLSDVWIVDMQTGNRQRLSVDNEDHYAYAWGAGGRSVVINTLYGQRSALFERQLDGTGAQRQLLEAPYYLYPGNVTPDGRWVCVARGDSSSTYDVVAVPMQGDGALVELAVGKPNQRSCQFSPDGRFVAFASDESGRQEVYVMPFPPTGAKWQVSSAGGDSPVWRRDGGELFYVSPENYLTALPVKQAGGVLEFGLPQTLFQVYGGRSDVQRFDVAPDGQRVLVSAEIASPESFPITLVTDWVRTLAK